MEDAVNLDNKYFSNVATLRADAEELIWEGDTRGEYSMHLLMQVDVRPEMPELVTYNGRMYVLCGVMLWVGSDNQDILWWCQVKLSKK